MSYQEYRPSSFKLLPEVVKNLLIINGIVFFLGYVLKDKFGYDIAENFGLRYPGSEQFNPIQFITHMFLHGNLAHIFSNMFALWMFGNVLENRWGGKRFLFFYFFTGLGAAAIHTLVQYFEIHHLQEQITAFVNTASPESFGKFIQDHIPIDIFSEKDQMRFKLLEEEWARDPNNRSYLSAAKDLLDEFIKFKMDTPTVGASGAVFGVLFAFAYLFPNTLLYVYFAIPIKAKYFVALYALLELYTGLQNNPVDNVAHFAHLGGLLFGFILIKVWQTKRRNDFY